MIDNGTYPEIVQHIIENVDTLVRTSMDGSTSIYGSLTCKERASELAELLSTKYIPEEMHVQFLEKVVWWHEHGVDISRIKGLCVDEISLVLKGDVTWRELNSVSVGNQVLKRGMRPYEVV